MADSGTDPFPRTPWVALATLGPIGRVRRAPGTWGSLVGLLGYYGVAASLPWIWAQTVFIVLAFAAIPLCSAAERELGHRDPGAIIVDECVAMPLVFLPFATAPHPLWALAGFGLFRFFDIVKPGPIDPVQRLPRGWGVVADDLLAAAATAGVLAILAFAAHHFGFVPPDSISLIG